MTRARDLSNDEANNGGATPPFVAGKNFVIGGGFDHWQRGTSFVNPASYTADRWYNAVGGATLTRQSTGAPSGSQYYIRTTSTSSSSYTDYAHYFETGHISPLWGKTVTYSFKVRKGTAVAFAGTFIMNLQKSSTVDAGSGATWTTIVSGIVNTSVIAAGTTSSDWSTFSFTGVVPNDGTANSLRFVAGFGSAQASGVVIDLAQVQLELGSVATPFARAGGSIGGELALCQRYYYLHSNGATKYISMAAAYSGTDAYGYLQFPVSMRVPPTLSATSGSNYYLFRRNNTYAYITALSQDYVTTTGSGLYVTGLTHTAGWAGWFAIENAAGSIAFSAEL